MNAVEIVKAFHELDEAGRRAALADTTKGLGKEIAGSEQAKAAIAHDYETSGAQKVTAGLSPDERVAAMLPSHPFRQGASLPEGIKVDAAGLASEIPVTEISHGVKVDRVGSGESLVGVKVDTVTPAGASGVTFGTGVKPVKPDYEAMTIAELRAVADKKHVDLTGLSLKGDIIAAIEKAK